jgi:hypothetical protein
MVEWVEQVGVLGAKFSPEGQVQGVRVDSQQAQFVKLDGAVFCKKPSDCITAVL